MDLMPEIQANTLLLYSRFSLKLNPKKSLFCQINFCKNLVVKVSLYVSQLILRLHATENGKTIITKQDFQ